MAKETSITNIFNRMSYNDREAKNTDDEKIRELYPDLEDVDKMESIRAAKEAQDKSYNCHLKANPHLRAVILLKIERMLSEEANRLSELQNFQKKDYSLLIDFFNYYSNICYQLEENWIAYECVVIVLSNDVPFFILGSVISAAFASGCPVIVVYSSANPWFLLFLKQVFSRATLPQGFFTLVPFCDVSFRELKEMADAKTKIVLLGNLDKVFHERNTFTSFNFVRPNNTATIIFEFSDLSAAIDKIINETWDKKLATMWRVSTVVVQESVYEKFLNRLKLRIDQLIDEGERVAIKNSIISEEDQNRKIKDCVPVFKVLSCRTANEGVNFLNSYKYYLGTSIWSENSSQALEVASKLICKNIWINCHGIIEPSVPFQPSGDSGNGVFGGFEGILEYVTLPFSPPIGNNEFDTKNFQVEETVLSAQKAFEKWLLVENKWKYLTQIAESLKNYTELCHLSNQIIEILSIVNRNPVPRRCNKNFYIIHEKSPIGVIAILIEDFDLKHLVYLITTAIALGNGVVLAVRESMMSNIQLLTAAFNIYLPRGLLTLIIEEKDSRAGVLLASNTIIQALWLYPVSSFSEEYVELIKKTSSANSKRLLFISSEQISFIYQRECLNNKIIWLTKVDHFP